MTFVILISRLLWFHCLQVFFVPSVFRPIEDAIDHLAHGFGLRGLPAGLRLGRDFAGLGNQFLIKRSATSNIPCQWRSRGPSWRRMTGPPSLMMPEIEPGPLDLLVEFRRRDQFLIAQ